MSADGNGRDGSPGETPEALAERVLDDLRRLGRLAAERAGLSRGERAPLDGIVVPVVVSLETRGPVPGAAAEAARLVRDLEARVEEALRGAGAYRPGRVHCFQCGTSDCSHAVPGGPTETFQGWGPTGKPEWIDFANLLLERQDPRVDRLYAEPPEVVALWMRGRELHGRLMAPFGRDRSFRVLGQAIAGLVPEARGDRASEGRRALTLQVVETRWATGGGRLRLNVVGLTLDEVSAGGGGAARGPLERLRRLVVGARGRLDALGRTAALARRQGRTLDLESEVEPLLLHLRAELERVFRDEGHRTRHARFRHLDGGRPTDTALADARRAPDERLLRDEERDTVVVLGPRGRAHVYSPDGRHVTSLSLGAGETERKSGKSRWRPLRPDEARAFRAALEDRVPRPGPGPGTDR